MDHNSSRQHAARKAMALRSSEASIAAHGRKIESFNVEIRRNGSIRKRSFVLSASLGLQHSSVVLGGLLGILRSPASRHCSGGAPPYCWAWLHGRPSSSATASSSSSAGMPLFSPVGVLPLLGSSLLCGVSLALVMVGNCASERHVYNLEYQREMWEIQNHIDGERQEMIEIYGGLGLDERESAVVTNIFAKEPARFADLMMVEELGYSRLPPPSTGEAIVLAGFPAVLGYIVGVGVPLLPLFLAPSASTWIKYILPCPRTSTGVVRSPVEVAAHCMLAFSFLLWLGGCVADGVARSTVFLGSYAENRTRLLAALSTLAGAVSIMAASFGVMRLVKGRL